MSVRSAQVAEFAVAGETGASVASAGVPSTGCGRMRFRCCNDRRALKAQYRLVSRAASWPVQRIPAADAATTITSKGSGGGTCMVDQECTSPWCIAGKARSTSPTGGTQGDHHPEVLQTCCSIADTHTRDGAVEVAAGRPGIDGIARMPSGPWAVGPAGGAQRRYRGRPPTNSQQPRPSRRDPLRRHSCWTTMASAERGPHQSRPHENGVAEHLKDAIDHPDPTEPRLVPDDYARRLADAVP